MSRGGSEEASETYNEWFNVEQWLKSQVFSLPECKWHCSSSSWTYSFSH
ncbi:hypothetical protein SLEP1_g44572 [Rubroshorea leprosula]|uniref:Uncharacterized protein n=1 Tax=Rubroshorea leprosula TaxID=152421 RepID=A0AAV5LHN5_9ROSI|nr:hypothetical protein SLEP1_g44572 [Rubroshorea leprosula]